MTRSFVIYALNRLLAVTFGESRGSDGLICWANFVNIYPVGRAKCGVVMREETL